MSTQSIAQMISCCEQLAQRLHELDDQCSSLLADASRIDDLMAQLRDYRQSEAYKSLCAYDDIALMNLTDTNEDSSLKANWDEYNSGLRNIMQKYKENCTSDILNQGYQLREKYINGLNGSVDSLDKRVNHMLEVMKIDINVLGILPETYSDKLICDLTAENEKLRKQLKTSVTKSKVSDRKEIVQRDKPKVVAPMKTIVADSSLSPKVSKSNPNQKSSPIINKTPKKIQVKQVKVKKQLKKQVPDPTIMPKN